MDNSSIADIFSLLSRLMDIHGENSFRAKSYAVAAFNIDKLPIELGAQPVEKISAIKGIGDAMGKKILEIMETGKLNILDEYLQKTPPGLVEMLNIKGLGPKKIAVIWKEMGIETLGELLYACNENRLLLYKGFGEKTQQSVKSSIEFYLRSKGSYLYAEIESLALSLQQQLVAQFAGRKFELTGAFKRQSPTIDLLEWVTTADTAELRDFFRAQSFTIAEENEQSIILKSPENTTLKFYFAGNNNFGTVLFHTTSSGAFLDAWETNFPGTEVYADEEQVFAVAAVPYILPCLREKDAIISRAVGKTIPELIQPADIKGIIHCHSNWSDGVNSIEEMAKAAIDMGYEYIVLSDHSKSAYYAKGLKEERIKEQHHYIDELNEKLRPFKIFKSIEADILSDGALDYSSEILASFDMVIASVHSNLKMTEEKAMMRLLGAIQNPYTTILGHITGRLLLSREGYPVDHEKIIEACVENDVVIELNAHPRRLDIDWNYIDLALEKGATISIDPDAHSVEGFRHIKYGVLAAQKGGVAPKHNLSSLDLKSLEKYIEQRRVKRNL